nr:phospholipase B1, membrane-associated-like [Salvelinus alpinus]
MTIFQGLNYKEDWKLVTVLIGMNDICDYCKNKTLFSADNFIYYMTEMLDTMMNEVPRMIVNIVQILPMESLREVQRPSIGCELQKRFCSCLVLPEDNSTDLKELGRFCSCLVLPEDNSTDLKELIELNFEFQWRLEKLLESDRFFKEDFAVVLQPYLQNAQPPRLPVCSLPMNL